MNLDTFVLMAVVQTISIHNSQFLIPLRFALMTAAQTISIPNS